MKFAVSIFCCGLMASGPAFSAQAHHTKKAPSKLAATTTTTPPSPPPPLEKPAPVFEFQGQDTETDYYIPVSGNSVIDGCHEGKPGEISCGQFNHPELAGRPMRYIDKNYYNKRLYLILCSFGDAAYPAVLEAFMTKYGSPDKTETRKWESKGGSTFDNIVSVWKFRGGMLEVDSMGSEVGASGFTFTSLANSPPAEKPKVDF